MYSNDSDNELIIPQTEDSMVKWLRNEKRQWDLYICVCVCATGVWNQSVHMGTKKGVEGDKETK